MEQLTRHNHQDFNEVDPRRRAKRYGRFSGIAVLGDSVNYYFT